MQPSYLSSSTTILKDMVKTSLENITENPIHLRFEE